MAQPEWIMWIVRWHDSLSKSWITETFKSLDELYDWLAEMEDDAWGALEYRITRR